MELNTKQKAFLEFVKEQHGTQVRKYTNEPYWTHPLAVAGIVNQHLPEVPYAIEIALGHDLLEDTDTDIGLLAWKLWSLGYEPLANNTIVLGILSLTDIYTKEDYPELNRKQRKQLEAERLGKIDVVSQSVKYADLLHNSESIAGHAKYFAKVYLQEKKVILELMNKGHKDLYDKCVEIIS